MDLGNVHLSEQLPAKPATLLLVDDTPGVITLMSKMLRSHGFEVLTADSGEKGLELLAAQEVDLVISDLTMPHMDGAEFLAAVRERWPATIRILLTGVQDIKGTIAAINRGEIYRYIAKPWRDGDVLLLVRQALQVRGLARDKARLEALTKEQNLELKALNAGLEDVVAQRTASLQKAMNSLTLAHNKLKRNFTASIAVFSNLIELRQGDTSGQSRRIADMARRIALRLNLSESEQQDVVVAALLRDIGKLSLPDRLLKRPFAHLSQEDQAAFCKHPVKGEAALMALDQLDAAAHLIRSQFERCDGMGYPDRLAGEKISIGSRIIAVARDFEGLQRGTVTNVALSESEARQFILTDRGRRYDPQVVDALVALIGAEPKRATPQAEKHLSVAALQCGMVLARDLTTREGLLLLSRDHVLDASLIQKIRNYEHNDANPLEVRVRVQAEMV